VISKFHVIHEGKTELKNPDADPYLLDNSIVIQFLGFQKLTITPLKAEQGAAANP
jgi:hypothetical protein